MEYQIGWHKKMKEIKENTKDPSIFYDRNINLSSERALTLCTFKFNIWHKRLNEYAVVFGGYWSCKLYMTLFWDIDWGVWSGGRLVREKDKQRERKPEWMIDQQSYRVERCNIWALYNNVKCLFILFIWTLECIKEFKLTWCDL